MGSKLSTLQPEVLKNILQIFYLEEITIVTLKQQTTELSDMPLGKSQKAGIDEVTRQCLRNDRL